MNIKVGRQAISEATEKLKNWGRWGNDEPDRHAQSRAARGYRQGPAGLIQEGQGRSRLGIPLDANGPADRPVRRALQSHPPDARRPAPTPYAGRQDWNKIRYADDTLNLCVQGATHWDAPRAPCSMRTRAYKRP